MARNVTYSECNSFEEVCKHLNRAFAEIDEINFILGPTRKEAKEELAKIEAEEAKIAAKQKVIEAKAKRVAEAKMVVARAEAMAKARKAAEVAAEKATEAEAEKLSEAKAIIKKAKKKGSVLMKTLISLVILIVLAFSGACLGADQWPITYSTCSTPDQLVQLLTNRFANQTGNYFTFDPTDTAPPVVEGRVYYKDSAKKLQLYNGTSWLTLDLAGGVSLDSAYDFGSAGAGKTISVTDGTLVFTATEGADNIVLKLVQADTNATASALWITTAGGSSSYIAIDVDGQSTGRDFEGTVAIIEGDGSIIGLDLDLTGTGGITFKYDEIIQNNVDGKFEFDGDGEDMTLDLSQTDIVAITSDTDAVTFDFGTFNTLTGMETITGSSDGDFTLQTTSNTGGEDLVIQQLGSGAYSVEILSAGIGTDSILIQATKGIDIDSNDDMAITNTATTSEDDFLIQQVGNNDSSLLITSAGTGADAISLTTSASTGDIVINAGDTINIDAGNGIAIDIAGAGGQDFVLKNTLGSIILEATEASADAIVIKATTAAGGIDIQSQADIDIITTGTADEDISLVNTGGSINLSATEEDAQAIFLAATGTASGIDVDAGTVGLDVDTTGPIALTSTENAADSIALISTLGGIDITCVASGDEAIDISNAQGSVNISSAHDQVASISIATSDAAGQILIDSGDETADGINIDAAGGIDIDVTIEHFTIDLAAAGKHFDVDSAGGSIYLDGGESGAKAIWLAATGTAGGVDIDAKTSGIDMDAVGGPIALDTSGASQDITLNAADAAVHIDGGETGAAAILIDASHTGGGIDVDTGTGGFLLTADSGDIALHSTGAVTDVITITNTTSTETAAIALVASAGGLDVDVKKSIILTSTADLANAVVLQSTLGGIDILCDASGGEPIDIVNTGGPINIKSTEEGEATIHIETTTATGQIQITCDDTSTDALEIDVLGGIEMDAADDITFVLTTSGDTEDFTIQVDGDNNCSIILDSDGTSTDAILLQQNTAAAGCIKIHANDGTATADGAGSIQLLSDLGGIGIKTTGIASKDAIRINAGTGGGINMDATEDIDIQLTSGADGEDILITQVGAKNASITLTAAGWGSDAIALIAGTGGIDITCSAGDDGNDIDISNTGGSVNITATENVASCIYLRENSSSTSGTIQIHADKGTAVADGAASIQLLSDAGAIGLKAALANANSIWIQSTGGGVNIDAITAYDVAINGGQVLIASIDDAASAIALTANVGTSETIVITNTQGIGTGALTFTASAGGINIDGVNDVDITCASVATGDDLTINQTGAHDAGIIITAAGTGADAISLQATAGSVDIDAVASGDITINGGQILVTSEHNTASAIALVSNTGTSETIVITNTQGQGTDAINIDTSGTGGGIDVDTADGAVTITAGGGSNGDITLTAGDILSLTAADPIGILVSTGTSKTHNYAYYGIGYVDASHITCTGGASPLVCSGLAAGVAEAGSTQGYTMLDDLADILLLSIRLPDDCVITDTDTDLVLDCYLHEQLAGTAVNINIYEYGATGAIFTDTYVTADGISAGWVTMTSKATGFGADTDLDPDDTYIIKLDTVGDANDVDVYGFRLKYRCGLAATQ